MLKNRRNKRLITFILLMVCYYLINLITSDIRSGMSGRMQVAHNIFNQLTIGFILVYMSYYVVFRIRHHITYTEKILYVFLFYVLFRQFVFLFENEPRFFSHLNASFSLDFWIVSFLFCIEGFRFVDKEKINKYLIALIVTYLFYLTFKTITQKDILHEEEILGGINVAGSVYFIVPLIMLVMKGKWKTFCVFYCFAIAIYSAKREAVVGMAIVSVFAFYDVIIAFFKGNKIRNIAVLCIILGLVYANRKFITSLADDLIARNEQFEETDTEIDNGRQVLREAALIGYFNAPISKQIFGGGTGQCRIYIIETINNPRFPHNGFIEILSDCGFVALLMFFLFLISIIITSRKMKKREERFICYSIVAAWTLSFSVFHASNITLVFFAIAIGYLYNQALPQTNKLNRLQYS